MRRGKRRAWRSDFLAVLAALGGNVALAAISVGIARNTVYTTRRRHPDFATAMDSVLAAAQLERRSKLDAEQRQRLDALQAARADRRRPAQALSRAEV